MSQTYTQCVLHRPVPAANAAPGSPESVRVETDTAWIPTALARKGKVLKIKFPTGIWSLGWVVVEVGATWSTERVNAYSNDWRHQREVSDI